jgi:TRAP-type transport system periplasmic protein
MFHSFKSFALATAAVGTLTAAPLAVTTANAAELKLAHFMPSVHPLHKGVFAPLVKALAKETNGDLKVKIFAGGSLGKGPFKQYKRVLDGVADLTFGIVVYTPKLFPKTLLASKPGVGRTAGEVTKSIWDVYDAHLKDEFTKAKVLGLWSNGPACLVTKKRVTKLSDVKGLKIRTPSAGDNPQVAAWGAIPIQLPITQTYNAFQNGVIDGVYVSAAALYRPWNLVEPGKYVACGMKSPGTVAFLLMNKASWNKLSAKNKAAINKHTGREFSIRAANTWYKTDLKAFKTLKTEKRITQVTLSPATIAAFDKASLGAVNARIAEMEKKGIKAKMIYQKLTK